MLCALLHYSPMVPAVRQSAPTLGAAMHRRAGVPLWGTVERFLSIRANSSNSIRVSISGLPATERLGASRDREAESCSPMPSVLSLSVFPIEIASLLCLLCLIRIHYSKRFSQRSLSPIALAPHRATTPTQRIRLPFSLTRGICIRSRGPARVHALAKRAY